LVVPSRTLCLDLADVVETKTFWPVRIAPVALIEDAIGWLISLGRVLARRDARGDDASAHTCR